MMLRNRTQLLVALVALAGCGSSYLVGDDAGDPLSDATVDPSDAGVDPLPDAGEPPPVEPPDGCFVEVDEVAGMGGAVHLAIAERTPTEGLECSMRYVRLTCGWGTES